MPRVLIVTSTYAPAMIADMHRARHLAWELPKLGWQVEILAPDVSFQPASCRDDDSAAFFAPDITAHHVGEFLPRLFRAAGLGTIGWRALLPMARRGLQLLAWKRLDLVYISTAQLPLFLLGPLWRRFAGVPYVLDLHDPGYRDDAERPSWLRSGFKHGVGRWLAKRVERHAAADAAAIVSVSASYIDTLRRRHADTKAPWLDDDRTAVIPFAVRPEELSEAAQSAPNPRPSDSRERARIVYVGAGGPVMARSFVLLCRVLARLRDDRPGLVENVTIALAGTTLGWRDGDRCHLAEIAREHGLGDIVEEDPRRLSYRGRSKRSPMPTARSLSASTIKATCPRSSSPMPYPASRCSSARAGTVPPSARFGAISCSVMRCGSLAPAICRTTKRRRSRAPSSTK
jgi:hypothetical protein